MKKAAVYIHGKGGSIDEANHYKKFFDGNYDVAGFDSCGGFNTLLLRNVRSASRLLIINQTYHGKLRRNSKNILPAFL